MATTDLAKELGDIEETLWNRQEYKHCEMRQSFNKDFYFFRLFDSRTFKNIKGGEAKVPISNIWRESKSEQEAVIKISDYIASMENNNFDILRVYAKADSYKR